MTGIFGLTRRHVLAALLALAAAPVTLAADKLVVVKVLSFSCNVCKASESQDGFIRGALRAHGGEFVPAPIPMSSQNYSRELAYYAARRQGGEIEPKVRASLYQGAQDYGYPLSNDVQVLDWLRFDLDEALDHERLAKELRSPETEAAMKRAVRLALSAGAQSLPTYVLLEGSHIVQTFDPSMAGNPPSLTVLRTQVVQAINERAKR